MYCSLLVDNVNALINTNEPYCKVLPDFIYLKKWIHFYSAKIHIDEKWHWFIFQTNTVKQLF